MVRDKKFYQTILRLSLPAAFQSAVNLLVVMADNVMVTRTGGNALSAVAQSNAITTFVTAALGGLSTGAIVLISQYWGKRDEKRIRTVAAVSASVCLLFALLGRSLFPFTSPNDAAFESQIPEALYSAIVADRAALFTRDAWRSFFFIAAAFAVSQKAVTASVTSAPLPICWSMFHQAVRASAQPGTT